MVCWMESSRLLPDRHQTVTLLLSGEGVAIYPPYCFTYSLLTGVLICCIILLWWAFLCSNNKGGRRDFTGQSKGLEVHHFQPSVSGVGGVIRVDPCLDRPRG